MGLPPVRCAFVPSLDTCGWGLTGLTHLLGKAPLASHKLSADNVVQWLHEESLQNFGGLSETRYLAPVWS